MSPRAIRMVYWTPRLLGMLVTLYIALFALDAFGPGQEPGQALVGFAIHLVPALVVAAVVALAWRWEWVGAALCFVLATVYALTLGLGHPLWIAAISGPLALVGALFLVNWLRRDEVRRAR
jgi:hypothetical protein